MKNKTILSASLFTILLMGMAYGIFTHAVYQLTHAGTKLVPVKQVYIFLAKTLRHLPFSARIANESELGLTLAYHIQHSPKKEYVSMMENGGLALKIYQEVDEKNRDHNTKYSTDTLLEIVNLMVRMPWDDQLRAIATSYANRLEAGLSTRTIPSEDTPVAHELLALYFSRMGAKQLANEHALAADQLDNVQVEETLANALIFLRKTRMSLATCIEGAPADTTWEAKSNSESTRVVTHEYLQGQYYHAWDVALVQTAIFASKQKTCNTLATNYKNLLGVN